MIKTEFLIKLIRTHYEGTNNDFNVKVKEIVSMLSEDEKKKYKNFLLGLTNSKDALYPQEISSKKLSRNMKFLTEIDNISENLSLPDAVVHDIKGVMNAINNQVGLNKFLFFGAPGTGKTEAVKGISKMLKKKLYIVNISSLIDSKLGQTSKNIDELFNEIDLLHKRSNYIILFDEIDAIALDRINTNDIREMGRVTSHILAKIDILSSDVLLFATTNLHKELDKALIRRFNYCINFDKYSFEDISTIALKHRMQIMKKYNIELSNLATFQKIILNRESNFSPAEMENIIKMAILFSSHDENEHLQRLFFALYSFDETALFLQKMKSIGFTLKEIELLTGISKSKVGRMTKDRGEDNV